MRRFPLICALVLLLAPLVVFAQTANDDQVSPDFVFAINPHNVNTSSLSAGGGVLGTRANGSLLGIDSVVNFSSSFYFPGVVDQFGDPQFTWQYTMVGRSPFGKGDGDGHNGTTLIRAPVVPVNLDLRNADGSPRFVNGQRLFSDATKFVNPTLNSPIFQDAPFSSSRKPTQFTDAVARAEFFNIADDEWHTKLRGVARPARTMTLLRGTYLFALNPDGSCCLFVLVDANTFVSKLFPPTATDTSSVIGAAENAGDVTTTDISTFLFPNTFLFVGNSSNCCILGFHTYDLEPGGAFNGFRERRFVVNYSSFVTPGIFRDPGLADVSVLSHEMTELFNDPFVNNATPFWLGPNGNCQNNLETGDVIENVPNAETTVAVNGTTFHVQNEALLQWFAGVTPSNAINGQYSYPDPTILTRANISQNFGCTPPIL
jgi:hypothetical protein